MYNGTFVKNVLIVNIYKLNGMKHFLTFKVYDFTKKKKEKCLEKRKNIRNGTLFITFFNNNL